MWITRQLKRSDGVQVKSGQVTGGDSFTVQGEQKYSAPEVLFPYGFSSLAGEGEKAVMLNGFCAGISSLPDPSLEEGEVLLYSAGGASILLKNTGEILINGQSFPAQ